MGNNREMAVTLDVDESSYPTGIRYENSKAKVMILDTSKFMFMEYTDYISYFSWHLNGTGHCP